MFEFSQKAKIKIEETCPSCLGAGKHQYGYTCSTCDGKGQIKEKITLKNLMQILSKIGFETKE